MSYEIVLPSGFKIQRTRLTSSMSKIIQKNGIVIAKICSACKEKIPIEKFGLFEQFYGLDRLKRQWALRARCSDCIRLAWIDRYMDTRLSKDRLRGVKPMRYVESRITRITRENGIEVLECIGCHHSLPLCDFPKKHDRITFARCYKCRRTDNKNNKLKRKLETQC